MRIFTTTLAALLAMFELDGREAYVLDDIPAGEYALMRVLR